MIPTRFVIQEVQTEGMPWSFDLVGLTKPNGALLTAADLVAATVTLYNTATYDPDVAAFADLVIGATDTHLASILRPFTSADVGRIVKITLGTGFTVGAYRILSVAGGEATMDRSVGTAGSTGGGGLLIAGIINGLQETNILNTGRGALADATGTFTISLLAADNPIVNPTSDREERLARVVLSDAGGVLLIQETVFSVRNVKGVP